MLYADIKKEDVFGIPYFTKMRRDRRQVVLAHFRPLDSWFGRVNPSQAITLALFDGKKTIREILAELSTLGNISIEEAEKSLDSFFKFLNEMDVPVLVNTKQNSYLPLVQYDPRDFIIPMKDVYFTKRLDAPMTLMLMLTEVCQTDCIYCYACRRKIKKEDYLPFSRVKELIDEAADLSVIAINLDGGDCMCYPHIAESLSHMKKHRIFPDISTKCYISKETAQMLKENEAPMIQLGLDAPYPDLADEMVQRKGFFKRTIESIENLASCNVNVRTNSIITRKNLHALPELLDLLMTLPLNNFKIAPAFRSIYRPNGDLLLTSEEKKWFKIQIARAEEKYGELAYKINWECNDDVSVMSTEERTKKFDNWPLCSSGRTQIVIGPDGKVNTCEQAPQGDMFIVGNVTTQSIMDVWNSDLLLDSVMLPQDKFVGTPCHDCERFRECVWDNGHCFLLAYKAYGSIYNANPYCTKASPVAYALE
jgi:radical SAM protein with 4Fe4S-binding SPASM domain